MTDFTLGTRSRRKINYPATRKQRPIADRFWEKVTATLGCWLWNGAKNRAGYGCFWRDGRLVGAHVHAFEEAYGPIPQGHEPDHLCEVKGCVNPEHMEAVTHIENVRRATAKRWTPQKRAANAAAMKRDHITGRLT